MILILITNVNQLKERFRFFSGITNKYIFGSDKIGLVAFPSFLKIQIYLQLLLFNARIILCFCFGQARLDH